VILFCVPYAGGGSAAYNGWDKAIAPAAEVRVAQLPGREERYGEPMPRDMSALVRQLVGQCDDFVGEPFALFGYSFGAAVAYALAVELQQRGRTPRRLFAGAARAPHLPPSVTPLYRMSDDELTTELRRFEGTTDEVISSPQLMQIFLPIIRADSRVMETYHPEPQRLNCPLTVLGGTADHTVAVEDLLAWTLLGAPGTEVRVYRGGHFVLHSRRERLCRAVRADLALDTLSRSPCFPATPLPEDSQ
jgi:surfactin synthase thioesterase subunit